MEKKKLSSEQMHTLLSAGIVFVIGILLCCSMEFGAKGLSYLIGISIAVLGALFVINSIKAEKSILNMSGFIGMILIAFGVMFIVNKMATIIIGFIPWALISIGGTFFIDSFLIKFVKKSSTVAKFVVYLSFGLATITLGICLKVINGFQKFAPIVLGAILIVYAVYMVFYAIKVTKTDVSK